MLSYATKYMEVAFNLAKKHSGLTHFNPSVGCVVVKNDKIISSAVTELGGRPHAENIALSNVDAEGADLFVTLEPCNHFGSTPPSVFPIINAKIKKVFVAVKDLDLRVNGSGIEALKKANIEVILVECFEDKIREFYKPYLVAKFKKSPFVSAKIICSLDGKIGTCTGHSKWISSSNALKYTNFLRHKYDGILIGSNTYTQDKPSLNCRFQNLEPFSPKKFLLSNSIKEADGFFVINNKFKDFLPLLYNDFKINHLLIEGGAGVITQAMEENIIDEIIIGIAPFFIGIDGKPSIKSEGLKEVFNSNRFILKNYFQVEDMIFMILENKSLTNSVYKYI
jgi:diaminohydroxyphosphoribosylaminopyrimidine deaminase / 5-amino-6-(5-phosphoribosylamino)uracil reductase